MALISTSPIINKISGSAGSDTFVNSRYGGQQLRKKVYKRDLNPSNPKVESNHRCGNVTKLWAYVSPEQHKGWVKLAETFTRTNRLGAKLLVRPIDLFKKINNNLLSINESYTLFAPVKVIPIDFQNLDIKIIGLSTINDKLLTNSLEDIKLYFNPAIDKDTKVIIYATRTLEGGINSPRDSWYRKIAVLDSGFTSGSSILNYYLSVLQSGNKYPYRIAFRYRSVSRISGLATDIHQIFESAF